MSTHSYDEVCVKKQITKKKKLLCAYYSILCIILLSSLFLVGSRIISYNVVHVKCEA
jgi:hypothetical protein